MKVSDQNARRQPSRSNVASTITDIATHLKNFRERFSGCSLAAFGDLNSRLLFRVNSENTCVQEYLDELSGLASRGFELVDTIESADSDDATANNEIVMFEPNETKIFVRSPANHYDFLCCIFRSDAPVPEVVSAAIEILTEVAKENEPCH